MEKVVLSKYESYYILVMKGWRNPDIEFIKSESEFDRFRRSVVWIYKFDHEAITRGHAFNLITSLGIKILKPYKLNNLFQRYNPYQLKTYDLGNIENYFISEISNNISIDDVEYDYDFCWNLVSPSGATFQEFYIQYMEENNECL